MTQAAEAKEPQTPPQEPPTLNLMGLSVHKVSRAGVVAYVKGSVAAGRGGWIITPNLDHLRRVVKDPSQAAMYQGCDLCVADGMPLVWGSRILGEPLEGRVAGSDLIWDLSESAARIGLPVIMLGGDPGAAEGAAEVLTKKYPGLQVAGMISPPKGFENDPKQMDEIHKVLGSAPRALVYVALGSPKQEHLAEQLRREFPSHWWIGIGISLGFVSGQVERAPRWVQRIGAEWLHRMSQEPGRLARRYLVHGIPFALRFLAWCCTRRLTGRKATKPHTP